MYSPSCIGPQAAPSRSIYVYVLELFTILLPTTARALGVKSQTPNKYSTLSRSLNDLDFITYL